MNLMTLRIAWCNLWRHPQRTLLMIGMVAFGSLVVILMWGVTDGIFDSMSNAQINFDQGDIKVFSSLYRADPKPEHGLDFQETTLVLEALSGLPVVKGAAPRLVTQGMLKSAYGATGIEIRGIDPVVEQQVTTLSQLIHSGRFLEGLGEILLSVETAKRLDIRAGERVVVMAQGVQGPKSLALTVVELFASGLAQLDQGTILIPIGNARALAGIEGSTEVTIALRQRAAPERVAEPSIVLADEPTANLDSKTSHELIDLMRRLNEDKGATFLFATHDSRLLDRVSRLLTLEDGRITQDQCR